MQAVEPRGIQIRAGRRRHHGDHRGQRVLALRRGEVQHASTMRAADEVAAVEASPIQTRCMSSNSAPHARRPGFVRLGAHAADDAGPQAGPVVGRRRRRRQPQRRRPRSEARADRGRTAGSRAGALRSAISSRDRQLAVVERRETPPHCRAGQERHTSLSCARSASRARASRDFTVPTAMPSENPISS